MRGPAGSSHDGMPRGSDISRPTERLAIRRAEYVNKYRRIKQELEDRLPAIEEGLRGLPVKEQQVLRYRYVNAWTWPQVSRKMNYSERQASRIHKKALEALKLLEK